MSDIDLDDELLALAGELSRSPSPAPSEHATSPPAPEQSPPPKSPEKSAPVRPPKGVAQRRKQSSMKSKSRADAVDDISSLLPPDSPDSLGSGAMSESESDAPPIPSAAADDDDIIFPVDGKFRSERDRAEIMALPEIKREEILAERAQELEKKQQDLQLRRMLQAREREEAKAAEKRKRKSTGTDLDDIPPKATKKSKTSESLEAYKQKRAQRGQQRQREDERKRRDKKSPSINDGYSDADADGESDVEWDQAPTKAPTRDEPAPELVDFQRARVGRSNFAKVCFLPPFADAIKGCVCRVSIGRSNTTGQNVYRMTQIKRFTEGRPYAMEGSNGRTFMTDQYVVLAHGKAEKEWPFLACSDGKITEAEFERFKSALEEDKIKLPTMSFLQGKLKDINSLLEYRMTDEDIQAKMKRSGLNQSKFASIERHRLVNERKEAVSNQDEAAIARIDQELAALDGPKLAFGTSLTNGGNKTPAGKPLTQQERLAALNRANRKANAEEVRKAQIAERRAEARAQAAVARGEAVANPFARVKTRAKLRYDSNGDTLAVPDPKMNDLFGEGSDRSRAGTPMTGTNTPRNAGTPRSGTPQPGQKLERKLGGMSGFKKKTMDDDVIGALDLGIEIDIS